MVYQVKTESWTLQQLLIVQSVSAGKVFARVFQPKLSSKVNQFSGWFMLIGIDL